MKPEQQRQTDTDIPPEIESIAGEGIKLFSRLINVASKSMTDKEFDHLCEAHSFGAVARNEFTLVPRAMLKALVDAAVSTEILKQQDRMRLEAGDAALNYSIGLDLQKENDALKQRIKRLEEAGDFLSHYLREMPYASGYLAQVDERSLRINNWRRAKEDDL